MQYIVIQLLQPFAFLWDSEDPAAQPWASQVWQRHPDNLSGWKWKKASGVEGSSANTSACKKEMKTH